jgi:thiol-disulfide isomerase/thioredoxin
MSRCLVVGGVVVGACLWALHATAPTATGQDAAAKKVLEDRFRQLDKDGDGRITTAELPQSPFFQQRDKNGDGAITLVEAMDFLSEASPVIETRPAPRPSLPNKARSHTPAASLRKGPQPLRPADRGVGRLVADATFTDLAGKEHRLSSFGNKKAVVFALTSTSCPLSQKYLPTLANLAESCAKKDVPIILIDPIATDDTKDLAAAAKAAPKAIFVHDPQGTLAQTLGARTTTDAIVLDGARTVVYHGAVDDQYGLGYAVDAPRYRYLTEALDALLADRPLHVAATDAPGCTLDLPPPVSPPATYHNRISRIVQSNCLECHRDGGVAPFSLATYEDVVAHAGMIRQVVEQGIMPPWFAAPADESEEHASLWANDRSLAAADKSDLLAWLSSDKPRGDERDAPRPRSFASGWIIGKPDAVFEYPEPVSIKATGMMPYQNVIIDTGLKEDKWVQAIEVQPSHRSALHHMLIYVQTGDRKDLTRRDEMEDERAGFWAIYVPGNSTLIYPEGFAKRLPKGARLRCQGHYTTNGTAAEDRTRIGVVYAKRPPQHEVFVSGVTNPNISIPPGVSNHREEAALRVPLDIHVLGFLPHMHARATACRYKVIDNDNSSRALLDIPRYDFNWQLFYRYFEPQPISRGETIKFSVWYDNSEKNPANPDPRRTVRWGLQASDEMHVGYIEYYAPGHKPGEPLTWRADPPR